MKLPIVDLESAETEDAAERVATIHEDGSISAVDSMVEEDLDAMLGENRAAAYRYSSTEQPESGEEPIIVEEMAFIEPGEQGYLAVVGENITYPYGVDWENTDTESLQDPEID